MIIKSSLIFLFAILFSIVLLHTAAFGQGGLLQLSVKEQEKEKRSEQKNRDKIKKSGISSVAVWKQSYSFGKPDKKGRIDSKIKYDNRGNSVEEIIYNANDVNIFSKTNYKYDRSGKVVEELLTKGDNKNKKNVFRYDSSGKKSEVITYKPDGTIERKMEYIYTSDDQPLESISRLVNGQLYSRDTYTYDRNGNMTEHLNSTNRFTYFYNDSGSMTEIVKYSRDLKNPDSLKYTIAEKYIFQRDSIGNATTVEIFDAENKLKRKSVIVYNAKGNTVEEIDYTSNGRVSYRKNYFYDKKGNLIEDVGFDGNMKFRNTYKYDRKGNKTEAISYDQVNEPNVLTKYLYEKYNVSSIAKASRQSVPEDFNSVDSTLTGPVPDELHQLLECRIIASDGTYLGFVWPDTAHPQSIINEWGQYGFENSPTSIFNQGCQYGGLNGVFSPFNRSSPSPPSLYRNGKFVMYLTDNPDFKPSVSVSKLIVFLMELAREKK